DALGSVTSRTYHPLGEVGTTTDANGNTTSMGYNTLGRLTSITDPLGNIWSRTYDTEGIITSRSDPLGNTTNFVSDKMGRITQTTSPLGFVSTVSYDAMGRVATTTDPLNQITTFSRDARGQVTAISLPGGTISSTITRNALGEPTSIVDPNGNAWNRSYDTSGRLVSSTDPLGQAKTTTYDNRNRPSVVTFPGALGTQTLGYDAAGNVISINYSDGTVFSFSYDARNDLISANNGGVTPNNVSRSYDANGRISNSNGIAITRDAGERITTMTLAAGRTVTYAYDANDNLATVTDWAGGITTFTYDNAGRLTGMTRPNGVNQTNARDNDSRLTGIIEGAISSISLTRDANGQITAATRNVPQAASSATLTGSTQTFDAASQVVGNTYDVLGRRTAAGADTFNWDHASRLTAYTVGGTTAANVYDSLGRRISRTVGANTVDYVWNDGLGLPSISVEQRNATDFRYFVHTPAGDLLYSVDAATGSRNFYHFDEMGNTIFITDDAGTVIGSYAYTPFGQLIASTVALDNPFTWQGKHGIMDEGNGLYYVRARYYDANSGRFISRDAKKSIAPMTVNPYQYALNNPLSFLDVNGLDPQTIKKLIQGSIERAKKRSEGLDRETADLIGKLIQKDLRLGADEIYGESRVEDSILPLFLDYMLIPRSSELLLVLFDGPEISMLREKLKRIRQRNRELLSKNKRAAILLHAKKQLDKARKEAYEGGTRTRATQDALDKKVQDAEKAFSDAGGIESVAPELTPIVVLD
ncbi:MAG: RHS repeat-associated core domain-containing protein, partial [Mariprofundus sp.]